MRQSDRACRPNQLRESCSLTVVIGVGIHVRAHTYLPGGNQGACRAELGPPPAEAFRAFSRSVFAEGALPAKTKQLISVAVAHVTQCPYCIRGHTATALKQGVTAEEIMEAIWVAAECVPVALTRTRLWRWIQLCVPKSMIAGKRSNSPQTRVRRESPEIAGGNIGDFARSMGVGVRVRFLSQK